MYPGIPSGFCSGGQRKENQYFLRPHTSKPMVCVVGYYGDRLLDVAVGADDGGSGPGCRLAFEYDNREGPCSVIFVSTDVNLN